MLLLYHGDTMGNIYIYSIYIWDVNGMSVYIYIYMVNMNGMLMECLYSYHS